MARDRSPAQRRGRGVGGALRDRRSSTSSGSRSCWPGTRRAKPNEDPDWADRAAFDGSPAFERHRRYQSAKTRELHRTLDTLRKMRNSEFGTGNEEEELAEGEGPMANGECQMAEGECQVAEGGCDEGQHSELMTEGSSRSGRGTRFSARH